MNATKRKFNALLQGIGTRPPSTSSATSTSSAKKPDKKKNSESTTTTLSNMVLLPGASSPDVPSNLVSPSVSSPVSRDIALLGNTTSPPSIRSVSSLSDMRRTGTLTSISSSPRATRPGGHGSGNSAAAELEFLAKRRRIAAGASNSNLRGIAEDAPATATAGAAATPAGLTSPTGSVLLRKTVVQLHQPEKPAPRYCPSDREQLLRRLGTFQELTDWTPKPDRINEIEWAKRGWACQGKERLRCTLCSREVVVKLRPDDLGSTSSASIGTLPSDAEDALVDRYVDRIVSGHQDDCLWRRKGCDDHLLRLSLAQPAQALVDLRQRYDELCARKDFLPYELNLRLPDGLDLDVVLSTLPADFSEHQPVHRVALALALLGWQGLENSRIGAVPNSASCHACLRRLGLWMFKSKQVDLATGTVLEPAPMDGLDPVREHRFFCPWKNGHVQRNPGARTGRGATAEDANANAADVPGWAQLVQVLKNDTYLRNRVAPAGTRVSMLPSATASASPAPAQPATPVRHGTAALDTPMADTPGTPATATATDGEDEDEATRAAKDKERWARLRRVKSLFDPKGTAKKFRKRSDTADSSRPGTAQSHRPESKSG